MRALVVGASGQIGGHLFEQLREAGHAVAGTYSSFARPGLVKLDLADPTAVAAAVRDVAPDVVLLPAGWTWVDGCEDDPEKARRMNVEQPLWLAKAAAAAGALFVTWSTDYIFPGDGPPPPEEGAARPLNAYGKAKLELEERLRALTPEHLILRTTTVFGPEQQGKNFAYQVVKKLSKGERMTVPDDQRANPSYSPDVARATLALVDRGARGTWHVAGPDHLDRADFARRVARAWGLDASLIESKPTASMKQKAPRPLRGGLDTKKLESAGLGLRGIDAALQAMKAEIEAGRAARP